MERWDFRAVVRGDEAHPDAQHRDGWEYGNWPKPLGARWRRPKGPGTLLVGEECLPDLALGSVLYGLHLIVADGDKVVGVVVDIPEAVSVSQ